MGLDKNKGSGEIAELQQQLQQMCGPRSNSKETIPAKRELFRRIINNQTVGSDVSTLFAPMIMAATGDDLIVKKMLYIYITKYAKTNPDLALLTINTLQKDCGNQDPVVRGLALRNLSSLNVKNLVEYLEDPVLKGLSDKHPYVRRSAVMGVLKIFHMDAAAVERTGLVGQVKELLRQDGDTQVIANCLRVVKEIEGPASLVQKALIYPLLNRIKEFNEWAQCDILDLVGKYRPEGPDEMFEIMNFLERLLSHANSAVVLATVRVFLHGTLNMPDIHQQVLERIKAPLFTLIGSASPEVSFALLSHLEMLVARAPVLFSSDHKQLYCRYSDPPYIKELKIRMMTAVADAANTYDIVTELGEYVADVNVTIARQSVRAVGRIALETPDVVGIVERLLEFMAMDKDYITAETLVVIKDVLRRFPERAAEAITAVESVNGEGVEEPEARAAFVWLLGAHGEAIPRAPYLLEPMVEGWGEEESPAVRLELLAASAKLFFKRPPECQKLLGKALESGMADSHVDVHDRALLYYRLLAHSLPQAQAAVCGDRPPVASFKESVPAELRDAVFEEFNTLSVIYGRPAHTFLREDGGGRRGRGGEGAGGGGEEGGGEEGGGEGGGGVGGDESNLLSEEDREIAAAAEEEAAAAPPEAPVDLLGMDDLMSLDAPGPAAAPPPAAAAAAAPPPPPPPFTLGPAGACGADVFQAKWGALPSFAVVEEPVSPAGCARLADTAATNAHMAGRQVATLASGGQPPTIKYYWYARGEAAPDALLLVELIASVAATGGGVQATIKADAGADAAAFATLLRAEIKAWAP